MKYKLFSVFDIKAKIFQEINMYRQNEEAVRAFGVACNDPQSNFHKFAEDFSLYELGSYDSDSGIIESFPPILVITASVASRMHNEFYAARLMDKSAVGMA